MRKLLYLIITFMMIIACDIHRSDNGDLDGFWQLKSVDTLSTGGTCDMRDSMFLGFPGQPASCSLQERKDRECVI